MVTEQGATDRKVVIDAGAAIKLQRLDRFGGELFTTGGVIREIKDENARNLLKTLPQELTVREPLTQDILFTKQFAKATGDLGFLSQNDIELIALTLALHREAGGSVRERPARLESGQGSSPFDWAPADASKPIRGPRTQRESADKQDEEAAEGGEWTQVRSGRTVDKTEEAGEQSLTIDSSDVKTAPVSDASAEQAMAVAHLAEASEKTSVAQVLAAVEQAEAQSEDTCPAAAPVAASTAATAAVEDTDEVEGQAEAEASDSDEDGSSAGEWVTKENMHRFGMGVEPAAEVRATCATADYSVQNVLLQMGITPLTFDGFAVRSVKLWGLICRACFHFTRDTQKVFCPKCGNDTVVRVPIIVDQDGQAQVLNSGRALRRKGTVYSVPKPQGGRGWKPIYAEDEVLMGGRDRMLRHAENLQNKERQNRDPFNEDNAIRAWYQRSGTGGKGAADVPRVRAGLGRANPNANNYKHKTSGRKKR